MHCDTFKSTITVLKIDATFHNSLHISVQGPTTVEHPPPGTLKHFTFFLINFRKKEELNQAHVNTFSLIQLRRAIQTVRCNIFLFLIHAKSNLIFLFILTSILLAFLINLFVIYELIDKS